MRPPRSCPRRATMAGRTAWATSRPTATASPTARCAPPTSPGYVNGGPAASADQRLVRLQQPRQRLDEQHRPGHAAAHHGHGQGRGHRALQQRLVQPRQPGQRQRLPAVPASSWAPTTRPNYGAHDPTQLCPYLTASGATVFTGPGLPLQGGRGQLRALAQVLGRPLVPQRLRQQQRQARAAAGSGDRPGRLAADLRGQLPRLACRGARTTWTRSSARTARSTSRSTRASSPPAPAPACTASSLHGRRATPRAPTRSGSRPPRRARSSSRSAPPAACPTSGTSATARPSRRSANPTHTYAADRRLQRQADRDLRRRREGSQDGKVNVGADTAAPTTTVQINGATPGGEVHEDGRGLAAARPTAPAGTGVDWIEHRIDGGAWIRDDQHDATPSRSWPSSTSAATATHTVEYRARDKAGNVSDPPGSVSFRSTSARAAAAPACRSRTSSTAPRWTPKWTVTRSAGGGPVVCRRLAEAAAAAGRLHRQRRARLQHGPARPRRTASGRPRPRSTRPRSTPTASRPASCSGSPRTRTRSRRSWRSARPGQQPVRAHRHPERVGRTRRSRRASRPPRTARCRPPCWCAPAPTATNIIGEFSIDNGVELDQDRQRDALGAVHRRAEDRPGRLPRRLGRRHRPRFDFFRVMSGSSTRPRRWSARRAARRCRISSTARARPEVGGREPGPRLDADGRPTAT